MLRVPRKTSWVRDENSELSVVSSFFNRDLWIPQNNENECGLLQIGKL